MGVLDELKQQAAAMREAEEERLRLEQAHANAVLAIALPAVFRIHLHLRELAEQLRVLEPDIRVSLDIPGLGSVPGFRQDRMEILADGHPPDRVVARFLLRYERRGQFEVKGVGALDGWLDNARARGLNVKLVRLLEPLGTVERGLVTLEDTVPASLTFSIERESGAILLVIRNFEELTDRRHQIRPEDVNTRWLDELSKFILRQPNRFLVEELPEDMREQLRRRLEIDKRRQQGIEDDPRAPIAPRLKNLFRRRPLLTLHYRDQQREIAHLETDFLIGRSDGCDLIVRERRVSRFHARIEQHEDHYVLLDESRNGTWVRFADGTEQHVVGSSLALIGSGLIGLGAPPDATNPNVIQFSA